MIPAKAARLYIHFVPRPKRAAGSRSRLSSEALYNGRIQPGGVAG
jgi:hypothetical protein